MSANKSIVLKVNDWATEAIRFTPPKVNDKQGKSINIISQQTGRGLHIQTPLMTTWGISDYVDKETGQSDGKFSLSLTFPNEEYANANTTAFLNKMKAFEENILEEAVKNSELWWGEKLTKDIVKYSFFPILKYPKIKGTKKADMTKSPSISAKVPFYEKENRWNVEIYDTNGTMLFPCENEELTPTYFVPKLANVACVLQCGGVWIGGKGWGVTWKLVQAVVKPRENVSVFGKCQIQLSDEDKTAIETHDENDVADVPAPVSVPISTQVNDSDDEEPSTPVPAPKPIEAPVPKPVEAPAPKPVEAPAPAPVEAPSSEPVKKTVVKKVVKKATPAAEPAEKADLSDIVGDWDD